MLAEEMSRAERARHRSTDRHHQHRARDHAVRHRGAEARFLPRMLRGDDIWCQGFSEPDAGLRPRIAAGTRGARRRRRSSSPARRSWTTLGHLADWCELLVRTDPDAPKHKGISCLLVDMTLPGVEVRPLVTITGEREFNEIFFDDVRVPRAALLGPANEGWRVAMTTLTHERAGVAVLHLGVRGEDRPASRPRPVHAGGGPPGGGDTRCSGSAWRACTSKASTSSCCPTGPSRAWLHGRALGAESSAGQAGVERRRATTSPKWPATFSAADGQHRRVGPRPRLRPGPLDRRRHHPGEQEHHRPTRPRPSSDLNPLPSCDAAPKRLAHERDHVPRTVDELFPLDPNHTPTSSRQPVVRLSGRLRDGASAGRRPG